jgi:aldehyde dehydrogenase (NAD+)
VNVSTDMTIAREEIFGPLLSVITYDTYVDAIRIANDSKCGFHGVVLGTDLGRARRVASQVRAGRVVINGMTDDLQASGRVQVLGVGPRVRRLRHQRVSRDARDPRSRVNLRGKARP